MPSSTRTAERVDEEGLDLGLDQGREVLHPLLLRLRETLPRPRQVLEAGLCVRELMYARGLRLRGSVPQSKVHIQTLLYMYINTDRRMYHELLRGGVVLEDGGHLRHQLPPQLLGVPRAGRQVVERHEPVQGLPDYGCDIYI